MAEEVKRESFLFYSTYNEVMRKLSPEDQLLYIHTICDYYFEGVSIPETTGSFVVDIALTSIRKVMEANTNNFKNSVKGGAPKGNKNNSKGKNQWTKVDNLGQPRTTVDNPVDQVDNPTLDNGQPRTTVVDQQDNVGQPNVNVNVNVNDNVNVKENVVGCPFPFFDEEKERMYSGRIDHEDLGKFSLQEWYDMDNDVLIDGKFSVNEFIESHKERTKPFTYGLPAEWNRNLKQKFKEEMAEVYGSDAEYID